MNRRSYCRCREVRNFSYDEAAGKLGCKRSWLEANIATLPHQKLGQSAVFCDCELALIQAMFTVLPAEVVDLLGRGQTQEPQAQAPEKALTLQTIAPSQGRRRKAAVPS